MTAEAWRPIPGHPCYEASDAGRIRRSVGASGTVPGRIRTLSFDKAGYYRLVLYEHGSPHNAFVHRLVLAAFLGPSDLQANHKDGNHANNYLGNLEYLSGPENVTHAVNNGLLPRGEARRHSKLNNNLVCEIRSALEKGEKQRTLAKKFGVSQASISRLLNGVTWSHVNA